MITTNDRLSPKFKKGILTTHDLPDPKVPAVEKVGVITANPQPEAKGENHENKNDS
jgi:hypothetical protein